MMARATQSGAGMNTEYVGRSQTATVIDVEDLREFRFSMTEEFWEFNIGQFFTAGAFWLVVERYFTIAKPQDDFLLWICAVVAVAGAIIMAFSLRQLSRRRRKIDRIITEAEAAKAALAAQGAKS